MEREDRWKKLEIWKLADDLAYQIYKVTSNFPQQEIYGITSQLRRASLSIATNIVEGYSKRGDKELRRYIDISLGSLSEVKYLIYFSNRLGYLNDDMYKMVEGKTKELGSKLWKFYEKIRER